MKNIYQFKAGPMGQGPSDGLVQVLVEAGSDNRQLGDVVREGLGLTAGDLVSGELGHVDEADMAA